MHGRQRRAQIVRNVADQFAAQAVGFFKAFELFPDLVGHAAECLAQLHDFVARRAVSRRVRLRRDGLGVES